MDGRGMMVVEQLVNVHRSLDALREAVTQAYVLTQRVERIHDDTKELAELRTSIGAFRTKFFNDDLDAELRALVVTAVEVTSEVPA